MLLSIHPDNDIVIKLSTKFWIFWTLQQLQHLQELATCHSMSPDFVTTRQLSPPYSEHIIISPTDCHDLSREQVTCCRCGAK